MPESSSTRTLRVALSLAGGHVQRFEDKLTPGIPDMNVCVQGMEIWLEGKAAALPKRDTSTLRFGSKGEPRLAFQRNWLSARRKAGGCAFFWAKIDGFGWVLFDDLDLLTEGILVSELKAMPCHRGAKGLTEEILVKATKHYRRRP